MRIRLSGKKHYFIRHVPADLWLTRIWFLCVGMLLLELLAYSVTDFVSRQYSESILDTFNNQAHEWRAVDTAVPYAAFINRYSAEAGINASVVREVIMAESSFQPQAVSPCGALGLMQIMPDTWREVSRRIKARDAKHSGPEYYQNPELNIQIGTVYLGMLYHQYQDNWPLTLAAYNAGPGAVQKYNGIPPYTETRQYINTIMTHWYRNQNYLPVTHHAQSWAAAHNALRWWMATTLGGLLLSGRYWFHFRLRRGWR